MSAKRGRTPARAASRVMHSTHLPCKRTFLLLLACALLPRACRGQASLYSTQFVGNATSPATNGHTDGPLATATIGGNAPGFPGPLIGLSVRTNGTLYWGEPGYVRAVDFGANVTRTVVAVPNSNLAATCVDPNSGAVYATDIGSNTLANVGRLLQV